MRALVVLAVAACSSTPHAPVPPSGPTWPSTAEWNALRAQLHGELVQPGAAPATTNPWAREDQVSGTESAGWIDGWQPAQSAYAVVAKDASDIAAAVTFASAHHVKLVIKGTGHDYLGRSSAPNSLLVWTHELRAIDVVDSFVPHGCTTAGVPAVSLGAGTRWLEAYQAVTTEHHRYVQGGGCTSVGVAGGFMQGGGYGSFSKEFGTAPASLLEAEVVTADGKVRIANACSEPDLYWALRGGGGGTFGVVTRVTLATYPLPSTFGIAHGLVTAKTPEAYKRLLEHFVAFYREHLDNEHWGESVALDRDNTLSLAMSLQGLSQAEADAAWKPFRDYLATDKELDAKLLVRAFPPDVMWNGEVLKSVAPEAIEVDDTNPARFWWAGDASQVGAFWFAYISRWLPQAAFDGKLADALYEGSRHRHVELHFNKGLAGGSPDALARSKQTAIHPDALAASALMIVGAFTTDAKPNHAEGERQRAAVAAAVAPVEALLPDAGSYVNEGDYFEKDWQQRFWGANYARLLQVKRHYDPQNLFTCHHCVGSE